MLPRLDRLALHAKVAPTGAYVPCTPGQDTPTPEAAHAWLLEHPDELDLFTMEPLAEPIGEDTHRPPIGYLSASSHRGALAQSLLRSPVECRVPV